jgi:hypothetical protein
LLALLFVVRLDDIIELTDSGDFRCTYHFLLA